MTARHRRCARRVFCSPCTPSNNINNLLTLDCSPCSSSKVCKMCKMCTYPRVLIFDAVQPVASHRSRAARGAQVANRQPGKPFSTAQIVALPYARQKTFQHWQYAQARKAAARWCVKVGMVKGRRGRTVLWKPRTELADRWGLK